MPVGTELHLRCEGLGVAGRKIYLAGEATLGEDGPVAVRASALFVAVGVEHFSTHGRPDPAARHAGVEQPPRYGP